MNITHLPPDVLIDTAKKLPPCALVHLSRTSKLMHQIVERNETFQFVSQFAHNMCEITRIPLKKHLPEDPFGERLRSIPRNNEELLVLNYHNFDEDNEIVVNPKTGEVSSQTSTYLADDEKPSFRKDPRLFIWDRTKYGKIHFGKDLWLSKHQIIVNYSYSRVRLFAIDNRKTKEKRHWLWMIHEITLNFNNAILSQDQTKLYGFFEISRRIEGQYVSRDEGEQYVLYTIHLYPTIQVLTTPQKIAQFFRKITCTTKQPETL